MIEAIMNFHYMQNAVIAAVIASIICGIIGTIIIEKKLVNMSGGIAHASFGGIGAGYFLGIEPIIGGLFFAVLTSLGVNRIKKTTNAQADTVVNMFWSVGMALGILFIALTPGYPPDMTSYLFGDILTVNDLYIYVMIGLVILGVLTVFSIYNYWKLYLFDEEYAKIIGINVAVLDLILSVLLAVSIVLLIKVVGVILALAMLTIPPSIAKLFTKRLQSIMLWAGLIGVLVSLSGLTLSYYLNIPSGATIILVSIGLYFIALLVIKLLMRKGRTKSISEKVVKE